MWLLGCLLFRTVKDLHSRFWGIVFLSNSRIALLCIETCPCGLPFMFCILQTSPQCVAWWRSVSLFARKLPHIVVSDWDDTARLLPRWRDPIFLPIKRAKLVYVTRIFLYTTTQNSVQKAGSNEWIMRSVRFLHSCSLEQSVISCDGFLYKCAFPAFMSPPKICDKVRSCFLRKSVIRCVHVCSENLWLRAFMSPSRICNQVRSCLLQRSVIWCNVSSEESLIRCVCVSSNNLWSGSAASHDMREISEVPTCR